MRQAGTILLVTMLLVTAGCTGPVPEESPTPIPSETNEMSPTATTAADPAGTASLALDGWRERVLTAERTRVIARLENVTGLDGESAGVYVEPSVTVLNRTTAGASVRVTMPYSYEYQCGATGAVDGGTPTITIYRVTADDVSLIEVEQPVTNVCDE